MNKLVWIVLILLWSAALVILILALTDLGTDYQFSDYTFSIGMGFITITGFMKLVYNRSKSKS
ncbi:MAG TPA: hypothetical protein VFD80_06865 [Flavobacteriaceae bacterium]|nr:hypothetical protein [Flavobacteriaceae bacterium]